MSPRRSSDSSVREKPPVSERPSQDSTPSIADRSISPRNLEDASPPGFDRHYNLDDEPIWPKTWKAYTALFGCFLLMFNSWGLVNAYGTFASYYKQHLLAGTDVLLLNLVGSTQCFVVLSLSFVVGRLLDAGYSRWLTGVGGILVTLGMFMLSLCSGNGGQGDGNYGLIWLTQGLITGLGMACFFVSSSQVAATWFKRRKSFAIGIVASGASASGLIYPVMTKYLITEIGFNNAVRCVAGVVGFTSLLSFLLTVPDPAQVWRKPETWLSKRVWVDTSAFQHTGFCWFAASISFLFLGFYAVFFSLEEAIQWAADSGFGIRDKVPGAFDDISLGEQEVQKDAIRTFWLLSIMNVSSTLGRVGSAYLSDHFGAVNVHAIVTTVASLLILILWTLATQLNAAIAFVVLFGIFSGSVIGLPPASVAWILGPHPTQQARLGQWTGMMYTLAAIPALIGPVIAGFLIPKFGNYYTVQGWSGACLFVSALCMILSRMYADKERTALPAVGKRLSSAASTLFRRSLSVEKGEKTEAPMKEVPPIPDTSAT
ncbi:hypothetical protein H2201_003460 [Coniosporium apollinis]|uniref:Major facilitator superfamily (MFS) profile domain-containing protein n=1 Tax=Coniosporium apollinis TaxID=61459 RepID=A0ABQ9NWQ4_9PEZI|nr:hypothetical protein H2201_003460 [Coniosporium apollinis]